MEGQPNLNVPPKQESSQEVLPEQQSVGKRVLRNKKSFANKIGLGLVAAAGFLGGMSGASAGGKDMSLEDLERKMEQVEKNKAERKVAQEKQEIQDMHKQLEVINKHLDSLKDEYKKKMGSHSIEFVVFNGKKIVQEHFYIFDKVTPDKLRTNGRTDFVVYPKKGESTVDAFKRITVDDLIEAVKDNLNPDIDQKTGESITGVAK